MNLAEARRALGYGESWLHRGLLTEDELRAQYVVWLRGEDRNTEHYRCAQILRCCERLTDELLPALLSALAEDPDEPMAEAALRKLLARAALTDPQFEVVIEYARRRRLADHVIARAIWERRLRGGDRSDAFLRSGLDTIWGQDHLLECPDTPRALLEELAADPATTRRRRNIATARLRKRRQR